MIDIIKEEIKTYLEKFYKEKYDVELNIVVEEPKNPTLGDISIPMFVALKSLKRALPSVVAEATEVLTNASDYISSISSVGAFINILLDKEKLSSVVLNAIANEKENYCNLLIGNDKSICIDYSSPNIAKSFSIGHLRSTMIGNSLKLIMQKCGYDVTSINYLGDWGTQFGKMIVAYELWVDEEAFKKDSIAELSRLYVKFHEEAKIDTTLDDKAREAFRKVELGDSEYLKMWKFIKDESLKESQEIYDILKVDFDSYNGEAYYNDKMDPVVDELDNLGILKTDDGAKIVDLGEDIPPALIKRRDGGSLYITRDLAALFDRKNTYHFNKMLYVVGNEQKLHFTQIKRVLDKMGYDYSKEIEHINFGLYLTNGSKMSTRKGGVVKLYDVLQQSVAAAYNAINEKNPNIANKEEIAKKIGIGAIVFNDLKNHRTLDCEFDMDQMLKFEGQTGPYLQYTGVRIYSIIENQEISTKNIDITLFNKDHYFDLVKTLASFSNAIKRASVEFAPSIIAKYLLGLCQTFNKFYSMEKINVEDEVIKNTNILLAYSVRTVLNEGLRLLGIEYVNQM